MLVRNIRGIVAAFVIALLAVAIGYAQVLVATTAVARPALAVTTPRPLATLSPAPMPAPSSEGLFGRGYVRSVPPGTLVPRSKLPPLPVKSLENTLTPVMARNRVRPQSASGATIDVTTTGTGCATTVPALYAVNCQIQWVSAGLTALAANDYQDYYFAPNATSGTASGAAYKAAAGAAHDLTLATQGTYVLGVYNTNTQQWVTVIYINAGPTFQITVYQDAYHTTPEYQFDATGSTNAYIYLQNVAASDLYVVYIESTSINPVCVFTAPAQSPAPTTTGLTSLCNPSESAGETAPGGDLAVTWPITNSTAAGTYSVVVYDNTLGERLGQVQVSVTGSSGYTMSLDASVVGANTEATPSPAPARTPGAETVFAWDNSTEASVGGVTQGVAGLPSSTYTWSINDPDGVAALTKNAGTIAGLQSNTFSFATLLTPGDYPTNILTGAIYNSAAKSVYASQAFSILGYNSTTLFYSTSDFSSLAVPAGGNTTTNLVLENTSSADFGTGNGDGFAGIAFTTGKDYLAKAGNGNGIEVSLPGFTLTQCTVPAGCSETVTATDGSSWKVYDFCSDATVNATSECYLVALPQANGGSLASGQSIKVPNLEYYAPAGLNCTTACLGQTIELPEHGVEWSNNTSAYAWEPVYFTNGANLSAVGHLAIVGAVNPNCGGGRCTAGAPLPELHLYRPNIEQAAYTFSSPYNVTNAYYNIIGLTIKNTSTTAAISEIAIEQPGPFSAENTEQYVAVDANSNADWQIAACPNGLSNAFFCVQAKAAGDDIAANATTTIDVDENEAPTSYSYTDWVVESVAPYDFSIVADGTTTVPANQPTLTVDTLAFAEYSLTSSLMGASFSPSSASGNTATESINVTNTSLSADPYPDYVDNVLIGLPSGYTVSAESATTSGWSYLGSVTSGGEIYYWFSVCSNGQDVAANLPAATPLTAAQAQTPACSAAQLANALAPGATFTAAMTIAGVNNANVTATMYAHGANDDGWTAPKTFTLSGSTVSASVGFSKAGGFPTAAAVATNTVPTIGGNPSPTDGNNFVYSVTNSASAGGQNITSFAVIVPGVDVNGVNATDSSGQTWELTTTPTLGGNTDGCTVLSSASATTAGANGYINIGGASCKLLPGNTMTITFDALGPQSQSDSYVFQTQNINATGTLDSLTTPGTLGGETWLGDSRIQVELSIGLNVVVDPSNPGPGGSTPSVSCAGCAFSGSTVDLGTIGSSSSAAFGDIVDTSVYISSTTAVTWSLSVSTNNNPVNSTGSPVDELQTDVDPSNSTTTGVTFDTTAYTVVPTGTPVELANGTSVTTRTTPYDILENFKVSIGTESITPQVSTITYTLVAN